MTPGSRVNLSSSTAKELKALDRRFVLAEADVPMPGGAVTLDRPRSADDLISEADFEKDERLPYWADIWPSSTALSTIVASLDGKGKRARSHSLYGVFSATNVSLRDFRAARRSWSRRLDSI